MTPAALGQAIAAALGIAISPVSIAVVIILLLSPRARGASVGFMLGWTFGIVAAVTAFTLLSTVIPTRAPGAARGVLGVIQLVVGALLLALAAVQWRRRLRTAADPPHTPVWIRAVDRATFPIAFAAGFVMAVNPPNLLLSLNGGVALGSSGLAAGDIVTAIALFTIVAASTVLVPVAAHRIAAGRLRQPLARLRSWLTRHDAVILTVVFAVIGLLSIGQGIAALAADPSAIPAARWPAAGWERSRGW